MFPCPTIPHRAGLDLGFRFNCLVGFPIFVSGELVSKMVAKMRGHVIVMGYKYLGMYVVERLREMGLEFVVLVRDESQLPALHREGIPAMGAPIALVPIPS